MNASPETVAVRVSLRRRAQLALGAGLLALVYLLPFRAYGLNVEDEGTLLYQILRVTRGELPYVDFSTGYTPGFFFLNAALWRLAGDLVTFRTLLAVLHAGTVAGLAALLAGVARPFLALTLPLLYLTFIPLFPGEFCAFNIAYPAWFATAGWLATAGAMLAYTTRHRRGWLVAAGIAAAVTLAMKPNAGVFAFAASAASVLATDRRGTPAGLVSALCWAVVFVGILLGVLVVFGIVPRARDVVVYLVPLVLAMGVIADATRVRRPALVIDLLALGVPFLGLSAPWLGFFWLRLGTDGFLREVLLIGSGAADLYYVPFPAFEPWGLLLTVLVGAFAAAALSSRRWLLPRLAVAAVVGGVVTAMAAVMRRGLMPEGVLWSMIWQLQSAGFALTVGTQVAGVAWLWWRRMRPSPASAVAAPTVPMVLVLFSIFMSFQLYPRADFMHLLIAAPLSLLLAGFLLERVLVEWERALAAHGSAQTFRAVEAGTFAIVLATIGVGMLPGATTFGAGERFVLPFAVAPVGVEVGRAADLRALAAAGARLGAEANGGAPSVGFPSIGVLLFLSGARNPTPHDYFYPGRPDHREEADILDVLAAKRPPALAALNHQFTFFDAAQAYYFLLRRFVRAHYGLVERDGRFDVVRRDAARSAPAPEARTTESLADALARLRAARDVGTRIAAATALGAHPARDIAPTLLALVTGDDVFVRRAALAALLTAITRAPDKGLETYVAAEKIDRRGQVLLLRTVRDVRDARAASYLFAAVASGDAQLKNDALSAMLTTRGSLIAERYLWAGPEHPVLWPGRAALLAAVSRTLADEDESAPAVAFAAHLAGVFGDTTTIPALRARMRTGLPGAERDGKPARGNGAVVASAADALVGLAPSGLACDFIGVLARPDVYVQELVPTRLLDLAESKEPVRSEARRCIRDAIGSADVPVSVLWIAAALGDGVMGPALREVLGRGTADERRAAVWALGELPTDAETTAALAERADHDGDEIVRRLAAGAHAKQTGEVPRSLPRSGVPGFPDAGGAGYKTGPHGVDAAGTEGPA